MTTDYHAALAATDSVNAETINSIFDELDEQIGDMDDGTHAFSAIDVDGGAIDGTTIGGTTPGAGTFTNIAATNNLNFGSSFYVSTKFNQYVSATSTETVKWNLELLDPDAAFDSTTGVYTFTPIVTGYYFLVCNITWTLPDAGVQNIITLRKDAATVAQSVLDTAGTFNESHNVAILQQATASTHAFDIQVYNASASSDLISTDAGESWFGGVRVY